MTGLCIFGISFIFHFQLWLSDIRKLPFNVFHRYNRAVSITGIYFLNADHSRRIVHMDLTNYNINISIYLYFGLL